MRWALLLTGTALAVECFFRLPIATRATSLLRTAKKAIHTIHSSAISDHWKERILPAYAGSMFLLSMSLFLLVLLAVAPIILVGAVAEMAGISFFDFIAEPKALTLSTVAAVVFAFIRQRLANA